MSIDGFSDGELVDPPKMRELTEYDAQFRAMSAYLNARGDLGRAAKSLGMNRERMKVLVNRYCERLEEERGEFVLRTRMMHDHILRSMLEKLLDAFEAGDLDREKAIRGVLEQHAKLHDVNVGQDVIVGPQITIIDARKPWERDTEVIDVSPAPIANEMLIEAGEVDEFDGSRTDGLVEQPLHHEQDDVEGQADDDVDPHAGGLPSES